MKKPMLLLVFGALALLTVYTVGWKLVHPASLTTGSRVLPAATTPASRNAIRKANLESIGNALNAYIAAHQKLPISITTANTEICSSIGTNCKKAKLLDLSFLTSSTDLLSIPEDPIGGYGHYGTGYTLAKDPSSGKFRLVATRSEGGTIISIEK